MFKIFYRPVPETNSSSTYIFSLSSDTTLPRKIDAANCYLPDSIGERSNKENHVIAILGSVFLSDDLEQKVIDCFNRKYHNATTFELTREVWQQCIEKLISYRNFDLKCEIYPLNQFSADSLDHMAEAIADFLHYTFTSTVIEYNYDWTPIETFLYELFSLYPRFHTVGRTGNTWVFLTPRSKCRLWPKNEILDAIWPDQIDVKLTQKCLNNCEFCAEASTPNGQHANLQKLYDILTYHPLFPLEIAIGGGDPTEHPGWYDFITALLQTGRHVALTVHNKTFRRHPERLQRVIDLLRDFPTTLHIGISGGVDVEVIKQLQQNGVFGDGFYHMFHYIAGYHSPTQIIQDLVTLKRHKIQSIHFGILLLGFKRKGRAQNLKPKYTITKYLPSNFYQLRDKFVRKLKLEYLTLPQIGCDSVFLEQLLERNLVLNKHALHVEFQELDNPHHYVHDDGYDTILFENRDGRIAMYLDGVTMSFAPSSAYLETIPLHDMTLSEALQITKSMTSLHMSLLDT